MTLLKDPHGLRSELETFKLSIKDFDIGNIVKENFYATYKRMVLLEFLLNTQPEISHKKFIKSIIYDVLSAIVSVLHHRERYFQLNIRSMVEHTARISLQRIDMGGDFDITVRLQDFISLKEQNKNENWNYLHQQYTQACSWLHSSSNVGLNISATFNELLISDLKTNEKRMSNHLNTITNEIIRTLFNYYNSHIKTSFFRSRNELKYLVGPANFIHFQKSFPD
nr:hypothetical protein [uncultured Pantoea sp.]